MKTGANTELRPATDWEEVVEHIRGFQHLEEDWNGYGASTVPLAMIEAATECCMEYLRGRHPIPHAIYPFPDGNIVFEWYEDKQLTQQLEVEGPGRGELMSRTPDDQYSFQTIIWDITNQHEAAGDQ